MSKRKKIAIKLGSKLNLFFVMAIIYFYFGVSSFYIGLHNADLAFNMINLKSNQQLYDRTLEGKILTLEELYSEGINQMRLGFFLIFFSGIIIGYVTKEL